MVSMLRLAVVGGAVAVAEAKWLAGSETQSAWYPPKETFGATKIDPLGWTPRPTMAVAENNVFQNELRKRAGTSTCGYFASTTGSAAIRCINSASCVVNSSDRAMGCCNAVDVASCRIPTKCFDRTQSASWISGQTYTTYCSSTEFPYCVTYSFAPSVSPYAGFKALGCGVSSRLYTVEYFDPGETDTSSGSATRTSGSASRSSTVTSADASSTSSSITTSAQPSASTSTSPTPEPSQGTPVGPIVGGVVGGVAGLALIGFGVFFLMRYAKKDKNGGAPPPSLQPQPTGTTAPFPPGGPGSVHYGQTPPPMSQTPQQYGAYPPSAYAGDNRHSVAPSSYYPAGSAADPMSPKNGASPTYVESHYTGQSGYTPPPGAPGAQQQYAAYNNGSPQPQQPYPPQQFQAYNPQGAPNQPPAQQYPQQQQGPQPMELPTTRPERELRELA